MAEWLHPLIRDHGAWAIGAIIFLESMGLPLPGETVLVAAAIYAARMGGLQIEWVVAFAAIGAVLGDNCGYWIGREAGRRALHRWGPKVGLNEARLILGEYLFDKHGPKIVFFGRFTALLRTIAALLAGASAMDWRRFLLWNAAGGVAWTAIVGFGAYYAGANIETFLGPIGILLLLAFVAVGVWAVATVRRHHRRLQREAEAWAAARAAQGPKPGSSAAARG